MIHFLQRSRPIPALIACLLLATQLAAQESEPRTYVLVHGAWGSIASWYLIEPLLSQGGNRVYLASLTGHGDRAHLQSPEITLDTHILDVVNLIEVRDLTDIYLVGHSYGGMVITGVWDRARDRIKHIVYLDAFLPTDGKALSDLAEDGGKGMMARAAGHDGMVPPFGPPGSQPNPPLQSLMTFTQPLELVNGPLPMETERTYIRAIGSEDQDPLSVFAQFADVVRDNSDWNYFEIDTGHGVPRQDPDGLAEILLELE